MPNTTALTQSGYQVLLAKPADLENISRVIEASISAWPTSPRLKRAALPVLRYKAADFSDHEILLLFHPATDPKIPLALAAWQTEASLPDPAGERSTLLHGLYVTHTQQGQGMGRSLQTLVARRASAAGYNGLHVKAERFARPYFERCGYQSLSDEQQPVTTPYPYWFWQSCGTLIQTNDAVLPGVPLTVTDQEIMQ